MAVLAVVVLSVAPAGAPIQLSYVYSDSMEPAIGVDDGYVLVPADSVETGDIVTFWSSEKETYVTHRVVGHSDTGYLTKGDNNPTTDQRSGHPAVENSDVVGEVLTLGGSPVVIPGLGVAVASLRRSGVALVGGLLAVAVLSTVVRSDPSRRRSLDRVGSALRPLFLVGFVSITFVLAYGGGGYETTFVAAASGVSDAPNVVPVGSSKSVEFVVQKRAWPLMNRVVVTEGMAVTDQTRNSTAIRVAGRVSAPESVGPVPVRVGIKQYPAVVPRAVATRLHAVSPLLAGGLSAAVALAPVWALSRALLDPDTPIRRRPSRWRRRRRNTE